VVRVDEEGEEEVWLRFAASEEARFGENGGSEQGRTPRGKMARRRERQSKKRKMMVLMGVDFTTSVRDRQSLTKSHVIHVQM
jgi:hypothetical protein